MKKMCFTAAALLIVNCLLCQSITGNWEGNLDVNGTALPIVFHIKKDSTGKLVSTFDSPKQKAYNLPCSDVIVKEDSVIILIKMVNGNYSGKTGMDKKQITGVWNQGNNSFPLDIIKTSDIVIIKEFNRPQTPHPPYQYVSQDVEYTNADKSIQYSGTITYPNPGSYREGMLKYPAVILITGSGQQDRDETIFDHKPFAVIADHLTKNGMVVLRVDDRGKGKSSGDFSKSTTADFAKDVEASLTFLKTRKEVNQKKIGLIGHSEGGMIAPMVASSNKDIAFIILLAGPGIKITALMEQQNIDVLKADGLNTVELEQYRPLYKKLVASILNEKDSSKAIEKGITVFKTWQRGRSDALVKNTTGVTDDKSLQNYIKAFVVQLNSPWFNYFMKFNPGDYLQNVKCPVLALNGEKDIQVSAKANLTALKKYLSKNKKLTAIEIPGVNHLFQHCLKCTLDEYGDLEETFSPEVLRIMSDWIKRIIQ